MTVDEDTLRQLLHDAAPDLGPLDPTAITAGRPRRATRVVPVLATVLAVLAIAAGLVVVRGHRPDAAAPVNRPTYPPTVTPVSPAEGRRLAQAVDCATIKDPNRTDASNVMGTTPQLQRSWARLARFRTAAVVQCNPGVTFSGAPASHRQAPLSPKELTVTGLQPLVDALAQPAPQSTSGGCLFFEDIRGSVDVLVDTYGRTFLPLFPRNGCGHYSEPGPHDRRYDTPAIAALGRLHFSPAR